MEKDTDYLQVEGSDTMRKAKDEIKRNLSLNMTETNVQCRRAVVLLNTGKQPIISKEMKHKAREWGHGGRFL